MNDISAIGFSIIVKASNTYPQGVLCTNFPDDTDPMDFPEIQIAEYGMGLNGDLIVWSSPKALEFSLSLTPGSEEDLAMEFLLEANRVAKGKRSNNDEITISANYPDGTIKILRPGRIVAGVPGKGIAQNGRIKTSTYKFVFENKV